MKINKFIYTAVIGALFASCQSVETPMFSDKDAFVAFEGKTTTIEENANKEIQIPVSLMASKSMDVTVVFEIDTMAYAGKNAAVEGVNYRLKNTTDTLTFTSTGEMVQYISIEPIDNGDYAGDLCFDIKLTSPSGCNLGANYTIAVTISDDDHPLADAGILGMYNASGASPFDGEENVTYSWTCEVQKDADYVNRVWITQIVPTVSGATYNSVMGTVSDDMRTITINADQDLGTYGEYSISLNFNGAGAVSAQVSDGKISINTYVMAAAVDNGEILGWLTGVKTLTLTKIQE